jgi:hypothetical protein
MSFELPCSKLTVLHPKILVMVGFVCIVAGITMVGRVLCAQSPTSVVPRVPLPAESIGVDGVVRSLTSAFDQVDVVALGEAHGHFRQESDLRLALIRNPKFAKKVHFIVLEFASSTEQTTLDRYVRGENVSPARLAQVWKTTTQAANGNDIWDDEIYAAFFAAVRDANQKRSPDQQIRLLGADPGQGSSVDREIAAVSIIKEVLKHHEKVLAIFGAAHFYRTMDKNYIASTGDETDIVKVLERDDPGRTFVVIPIGRLDKPRPVAVDMAPDYEKIDRALEAQVRPVLVSAQRLPFRTFSVEEFLGRSVTTCRGSNGCLSAFKGTTLTLGEMADALVYFGGSDDAVRRR